MKQIILSILCIILISQFLVSESSALQQWAGVINYDIRPGESKNNQWGLISDEEEKSITLELRAEGEGSEFLSFPDSIDLGPLEQTVVPIKVSIPDSFSEVITLNPTLYATKYGEKEGQTIINVEMKKQVTLNILPKIVKAEEAKPEGTKDDEEGGLFGGCLIATATFGTELSPQVQQLRELRDNKLLNTKSGAEFMLEFNKFYYSFSPTIADWERENPVFKQVVKTTITPLITSLSILNYVDMDSEVNVLGYGLSLILLNVSMYFVAPAIVIWQIKKRI